MLVPQHPAGTSLLHLAMRPKSLRNLSWSHERNGVEKESVRLTWRSWQGFRWIHFGSTANNIGSGAGPLKPANWNSLKSQEGQRAQHPCPPELLLLRALEGFATFLASWRTTKSIVGGSSGCPTSSRPSTSCSPMPVGHICLRAFQERPWRQWSMSSLVSIREKVVRQSFWNCLMPGFPNEIKLMN